jgi:general L-amino acid transport system substrate-binding protein
VRLTVGLLAGTLALLGAGPAAGGSVIDRVRTQGVLHCGAVQRPGIAEALPSGGAAGVVVDICRAVGVSVLGKAGRISFRFYEAGRDFDAVRHGQDELAFLTGGEIAEQHLGDAVLPGPVVVVDRTIVMVPQASSVRGLNDLSGQTVCMMTGSEAQRGMEAAAAARHLALVRLMFQEDVEMQDAYNAGRCEAVAGPETDLAAMRLAPGVRGAASRVLPDSLGVEPLLAVTSPADGAWAARVAWVFNALLLGSTGGGAWQARGMDAMPVKELPGLRPDWPRQVSAAVGSYADIIRRNLTDRLGVSSGPNAIWPDGVLMPSAVR